MIRNGGSQTTRYYILSIRVLEWLVILVGCKIIGKNELEARESQTSLV